MSVQEKIRNFLITRIWTSGLESPEALTFDYPIVERQLIDSMGLIGVVTFLETEFGIAIEPEDISREDFATIASMARLVERLQSAKAAGA